MRFEIKYRLCLWHKYLGQGIGLTNILKYFVFMFGISSQNVKWTMIFGVSWAILCFIVGRWWFKHDWILAEKEVDNRYDLFVREMRKKTKHL